MSPNNNLKADLTLNIELKPELIEEILYDYVKQQFPEIPSDYTPGKVRFVINNPPTDMRGENMGSHTLGKAVVTISRETGPTPSRAHTLWPYDL
jgi:hypothetical protein